MKIVTRKKSLKLAGMLLAILIALTAIEASMKFMSEYKYVGFIKTQGQGNWISVAEVAQADNQNCQSDLKTMKAARDEANADIMK